MFESTLSHQSTVTTNGVKMATKLPKYDFYGI
jgi:hypothetical protein